MAGGEGTQARVPHCEPAAWQGQLHMGPCASFHPRAPRILVYIAEQAGRTETFPVSNFGIATRSFSSYSRETEGEEKKKRYLKETEGKLKQHLKETGGKILFSSELFFFLARRKHKRH